MRSVIYFNANINRISTIQEDFLKRFSIYSMSVQDVSKDNSRIITLLLGGVKRNVDIRGLNVLSLSRNPIRQLISLSSILYKTKGYKTLILGDNDISFILGWLASRFSQKTNLQISLHSSLASVMEPRTFINRIKRLLFKWSLHRVKSLRMVSLDDISVIREYFPKHVPEIIYAPVPLQIPSSEIGDSIRKRMAFVGRLHEERGLDHLVSIITRLDSEITKDIEIFIVGDGPKKKWLQKRLSSTNFKKIEFTGNLDHHDVQNFLPSVQVLLSCAESESYGMALREALLSGSMVVARENKTTSSLCSIFPQHFKTYSKTEDAVEKIRSFFSTKPDVVAVENFRKQVLEQQEESLRRLAHSWID